MPLKTQVCPLSKAMDSDTGDKYINTSDGWIRERVGMRTNGLDGNSLFNNKLKGNVLIDIALPSGTNKCIGWCQDFKTETIFWFVYNSNSNHSILRLFVNTNVIQKVWYSQPGLNLIDDKLTAKVVDGRVYWCNGNQELKSFNIEKAVNYTNTLTGSAYTEYENLSEEILPWIKRPPRFAPIASYSRVDSVDGDPIYFNNLRTKLFQFRYVFVYEDYQQSAASPTSKIVIPVGEFSETGSWTDDLLYNNALSVSIDTGSVLVNKIIIQARDCSDRNTRLGFYQVGEIEKYDTDGNVIVPSNSTITYLFLNNKIQASTDTEINNRYFDDIPRSADDLEFIDGKYLAASMPLKNYDGINVDYSLEAIEEAVDFGASKINIDVLKSGTDTTDDYVITLPNIFYPFSKYSVTISESGYGGFSRMNTYEYVSGETSAGYPDAERTHIIDAIIAGGLYIPTALGANQISLILVRDDPGWPATPADYTSVVDASVEPSFLSSAKISLKRGQYHPFSIVYNDGFGRYNIAFGDKALYSPISLDAPATTAKKISCRMTINHKPPIWATTYRVAYLPYKSYSYVVQIPDVIIIDGDTHVDIPDGKYFIQPNLALARARKENQNIVIPDYVWIRGDKLRILGSEDTIEILGPHTWESGGDPNIVYDGFLIDRRDNSGSYYLDLIEIFRPVTSLDDKIYYEIGEEQRIIAPGLETRSHAGNYADQSQDLSSPAILDIDFGDVYLRRRSGKFLDDSAPLVGPVENVVFAVEDFNSNDLYVSSGLGIGRAVAKIDSKQKTLHRIVKSENFIEDTEYNLLNVFLPQSEFFPVSQSYGPITGIKEVGDVLKVVQEHKETSVYIGKASLKQADGTNITVISDKVFNQGNKYDALYGTRYLRSIAANDRSLYYFDDTTGDFIRSSPNGQASISEEYRMKTYFKAKAEELRISTNFTDIITTIDSDYDEVLITFINGNESETIAFYEKEGLKGFTWKVEIKPASGVPDNLGWYGSKVYGFLGGKIYQHNVGVLNEFFGHQKGCSISFIVNAGAGDANKFSNIELSSNKNIWDIQFDIEEGLNYPVQKSILKPTIIRSKENRLYSDILKNILGRNNTEDISKLRRGQDMTGETMLVTISSSTSEDVTLKEVEVKFLTAK